MSAIVNGRAALSEDQRHQLVSLFMAGAHSSRSSLSLGGLRYRELAADQVALDFLISRRLVDSHLQGGIAGVWAEYWLTDDGFATAGLIVRGRLPQAVTR